MMAVLIYRGCQAVARVENEHSIPSTEQGQRLQSYEPRSDVQMLRIFYQCGRIIIFVIGRNLQSFLFFRGLRYIAH
jgi:hypothetical protein